MIPAPVPSSQPSDWRRALRNAVTSPDELVKLLELDEAWARPARSLAHRFPLRVPREFVARMRHGDPADPLLRQVLPLASELDDCEGYVDDPVGDLDALAGPGLLRKYAGRALLIATGACAVHCRYCFRRNFPYDKESATRSGFAAALEALRADESLNEVILSGGDPLTLSDRRLADFAREVQRIAHIRRLRVHTRLPVVVPQRIDEGVLHYGVTNMPGAVPRTSTYALSNATLPYMVKLANMGAETAIQANPALAKGVNSYKGKITYPAVAEAFGLAYTPLEELL